VSLPQCRPRSGDPAQAVYVGIGANLGDARKQVLLGIEALQGLAQTALVRRSSLYRTEPVDAIGPDFVNAVVELRTGLPPAELLQAMSSIEQQQGRRRSTPNAPRTLDLDLLLYGQRQCGDPTLTLPHPRLHTRAFVLRPLLEIAPHVTAPGLGPLAGWLDSTRDQRVQLLEP
jgi:2-amino-4-hydroxy-6-hydroxymethyldihydropteridine diphosphokinase